MKLLKICGIVAGIHAFALLFIFANPGCSSTTPPPPAADATGSTASSSGGATGSPITAAPSGNSTNGSSTPGTFDPAAALSSGTRYSPTRPGTSAATAVQRQPVADVTPAATYTVTSGDTLSGIAKKNHITASALASANNIKITSPLHLGQKLLVPVKVSAAAKMDAAAGTSASTSAAPSDATVPRGSSESVKHTVKSGETLGLIARKYGVKSGDIAVANNISDPAKIRPGMELTIPGWQSTGKGTKAGKTTPAAASVGAAPAATAPRDTSLAPTPTPTSVPELNTGPSAAPDVPVIRVEDSPTPAR